MTIQRGPVLACLRRQRLQRHAIVLAALAALAALPSVLSACPDAPRAPEPDLGASPTTAPPARVERAAVLLEPTSDAPAGDLRGAVVFEETTVSAQDGTAIVTLTGRYRIFGLTGPFGTNYRVRIESTERCADPAAGPGIVLRGRPLEPFNGEAEGSYDGLQEIAGLTLAGAIIGHAVAVLDGEGAVLLCGVARRSFDQTR